MIKLQDFAKQQGVTDRAIHKHMKTYADELEGLFERKGTNGTWLSDEACEILRSKMRQQPVVVVEPDDRADKLQARVESLLEENAMLGKMLADAERRAGENSSAVALLEETNSEKERLQIRTVVLSEEIGTLKAQNAFLSAENETGKANTLRAEENAQKASQELLDARKQFEDEKHLLEQQIAGMKNASLWQRIKGWKN